MTKYLSIALLAGAVMSLNGCGNEEKTVESKAGLLRENTAPGEHYRHLPALRPAARQRAGASAGAVRPPRKDPLAQMGIELDGGKLTIDTRKTEAYFRRLESQINRGINNGVREAKRHVEGIDETGIRIEKERVEIDLNKTRNFLRVLGESMRILGEELERSVKSSP